VTLIFAILSVAVVYFLLISPVIQIIKITGRLEAAYAGLTANAGELIALTKAVSDNKAELNFLGTVADMYPANKSYLRSQKAISDEVMDLRRQISEKLGGRLHVAIDTKANKLYFKKGLTLLWEADCSVGRGGILKDGKTGRQWAFVTPRGEFKILRKLKNPAWIKPDWAYAEAGETAPPPNDPARRVEGELGKYALDVGHGYLIHGTINEAALGTPVSHGCVRLGAKDLEKLFVNVPLGAKVYIY